MAREGCKIALNFRCENDKEGEITKQMVEKEGQECLLLPGDLVQDGMPEQIVQKTLAHFRRLDVLFNNCAVLVYRQKFEEMNIREVQHVFNVNCVAVFALTKAALQALQAQAGSTIINMSSTTAFKGFAELPDYSSSKAGVLGFTRSLALYLAKQKNQVRVNAIAPGAIMSPMIKSLPKEVLDKVGKDTPLGRPGQPEEVATCAVFLASQDSIYITGQTLSPNGGEIIGT
jgi:NAD(P)-dependent dehydrogenase (short-subunit alcohol dehydrogenase family)